MKILVMGTIGGEWEKKKETNEDDYKEYLQKLQAAAYAVGKALAEKRHTIVVSALDWTGVSEGTGVARYVVQGANAAEPIDGEKNKVIFYAPRDPEPQDKTLGVVDTLSELRALPNIVIDDRFSDKAVRISYRIPDVKVADAIIVVDGSAGIHQIATAAYSLDKPVVPLASLGDTPKGLYEDLLRREFDYYVDHGDITAGDQRALSVAWSGDQDNDTNFASATNIVALTEKLVAIGARADRENANWLIVTVVLTILSIFLWVLAFTSPTMQSHAWSFFVVLFLSVWPGIGLRTLVSYQQGRTARLTWQGLLIDFGVANVIAFGLALLFLVGNIAFTGELAVNFTEGENTDFARVAVIMSILGLAAGYLVPLGRLRELLENTLAQQK